jgi:hypothetical protein
MGKHTVTAPVEETEAQTATAAVSDQEVQTNEEAVPEMPRALWVDTRGHVHVSSPPEFDPIGASRFLRRFPRVSLHDFMLWALRNGLPRSVQDWRDRFLAWSYFEAGQRGIAEEILGVLGRVSSGDSQSLVSALTALDERAIDLV